MKITKKSLNMKKIIAVTFTFGVIGSLLILLALSFYYDHALKGLTNRPTTLASVFLFILKLSTVERFIVFAVIFLSTLFLIIDTIFVLWFLCKVRTERIPVLLPNSYKKVSRVDDIEFQNVIDDTTTLSMPNIYFNNETSLNGILEKSLSDVKKNARLSKKQSFKSLQSLLSSGFITTKTLKFDDSAVEFIVYNEPEVLL